MKKLKLPVDSLRVETFDAGDTGEATGTVNAHDATNPGKCCTQIQTGCNPDITTVFTGACLC